MGIVFAYLLVVISLFHTQDAAWAYSEEQQLISEAWQIVDRAYIDDTFNHHNWWKIRQKALRQPLPDKDAAYIAIQDMLEVLDDPFTRLLRPQQYRNLQTDTSGELMGVGLQLIQDQETGDLVVVAAIDGSPAQQAMIQSHDRIVAIDGQSVNSLTLDEAAGRLRGPVDSSVVLTVLHGTVTEDIKLVRDRITINP
ncbi:MAG: PDZ domain-containing protein, partial [Symploca sp. SIO2B6]|nr:PDZ domain-containing protein [Symploca sp. SIO2B6]